MNGYGAFAAYYDALMQDAAYERRFAAYHALLCRYGVSDGILLDLACGTGSLSVAFAACGYDVIGVDASAEMLMLAQQKAARRKRDVLFLCQPMQQLDLYGTVRGTVCALDSLNHLTAKADVAETIRRVALFTEPDGLFVFDVNTVYKHRCVLADNTFVLETQDVYCVWQNAYRSKDDSVRVTLDFFEKEGDVYVRSSEEFRERAYETDWLCSVLEQNGFAVREILAEDAVSPPGADTQRILFAAQKKGNQ